MEGKTLLLGLALCGLTGLTASAQSFDIDMTKAQAAYSDANGQGYDLGTSWNGSDTKPFYYSVKVPDGNYKVTVTLGSRKRNAATVVRAESRRLLVDETATKEGKSETISFLVNKHSPEISAKEHVKLKKREVGSLNWDDKLTLEFNGSAPAVERIKIERDTTAVTVYLCGNSTVVDQREEPYASWGQMVPVWFNDKVCIANIAESGLTAGTFLGQNRLDKILSMMKKGDYVFCEFGHNDQKEKSPGHGAWYNFSYNLKKYIDLVRAKGGNIIFVTPTQRRHFDDSHTHILETHGDYPDAMRTVAKREGVPVIELHDMTRTFFESLGYENSTKALVHYPAGTFPGQTTALADNTHFNPYGAYEVAKMVVMGMKKLNLPFVKDLRPTWHDFEPTHPDDFKTYKWYMSSFIDVTKPAGN